MSAVVRRGLELRRAVRQRRRARWIGVAATSFVVATSAAMVARGSGGLGVTILCASSFALVVNLVGFIPALERRALRAEITRPPLTRAQAARWAAGSVLVGVVAVAVALVVGALADAWLMSVAVAAPNALLCALAAFFMLRAGQRDDPHR